MKKINPKENRHKTPRFTWFGNSLHPGETTNKFHYIKFGIIEIGVEALSQTQITNTKPKNQRFTTTKHEYQIPNTNCTQIKERATKQIQKLQRTKRE